MSKSKATELCRRFRPKTFADIVGQNLTSLERLVAKGAIPHAIIFAGPKGCGKTTSGRVLAKALECSEVDCIEMNCAKYTGVDDMRMVEDQSKHQPFDGDVKVWILDECHRLTANASDTLLKILEEPPDYVYFILCTTNLAKVPDTIRDRCTLYTIRPLTPKALNTVLHNVMEKAKIEVSTEVLDKIIENADGSARSALVLLNKVYRLEREEDMLEEIQRATIKTNAIEIARALCNKYTKWQAIAKILRGIEGEDPEQIRYLILSFARRILITSNDKGQMNRAACIIDVFGKTFIDSKAAGLALACYSVLFSNS